MVSKRAMVGAFEYPRGHLTLSGMLPLTQKHILDLSPYVPGKSSEELGKRGHPVIKLASNESALGPSPKAILAAQEALAHAHIYPLSHRYALKERICQEHAAYKIHPDMLALGNGSNELINLFARAFLAPHEALLNAWPSFIVYRTAAKMMGAKEYSVPLLDNLDYDLKALLKKAQEKSDAPVKMLFLSNPNNPTGKYLSQKDLFAFVRALPQEIIVVIDEAYVHYVEAKDYGEAIALVNERPRTAVLRTFSKVYGLAALRIGYAICDREMVHVIRSMRDPFNVNGVAQRAALAALDDIEHVQKNKILNSTERTRVTAALAKLGVQATPSEGNFLLLHLDKKHRGTVIFEKLLERGIIVRVVDNYDFMHAVRVSIGTKEQNTAFLQALSSVL